MRRCGRPARPLSRAALGSDACQLEGQARWPAGLRASFPLTFLGDQEPIAVALPTDRDTRIRPGPTVSDSPRAHARNWIEQSLD